MDILDPNGTFMKLQKPFVHAEYIECSVFLPSVPRRLFSPTSNPIMLSQEEVLFYTEAEMTFLCLSPVGVPGWRLLTGTL